MSRLPSTIRSKEVLERLSVDFTSIDELKTLFTKFGFAVGDIVKIKNSSTVEYRVLSTVNNGGEPQVIDETITYYWNLIDMNVKKFVESETALTSAKDYTIGDVVFCFGRTRAGDGYHSVRIKASATAGDNPVTANDGTFWNIVDDKALTARLETLKNNLTAAIDLKISKANIIQDFGVGGVDKVPSAELFNSLYQIVSNLQGGASLKSKLTVERMLGIDSGVKILNKGAKTIVSDKGFFFAPKLYIEGQLWHSDKYTLDAVGGLITLTEPYSLTDDVPYQIFDEYPRDIKFAIDTVLLLTGSNLKDELEADDVIKILGDSSRYDGGQHLRIVETTSKLNGIALGNGLFLNEVPNSRLKSTEEKATFNRRDILNVVGGLGANGGGREYSFIQDAGQKDVGKFYLDQNTLGIYKCVAQTNSVNNDSSFEKVDLDATSAKLQNLVIKSSKTIFNETLSPGQSTLAPNLDKYSDDTLFRAIAPNTTSTTDGNSSRTTMIISKGELKSGITMHIRGDAPNAQGNGIFIIWKLINGSIKNVTTAQDSGFTAPAVLSLEELKISSI